MNAYKANIACSVFFLAVAVVVWHLIPVGIVVSDNYAMGNPMLNSRFMPKVLVVVLVVSSLVNIAMNMLSMKLARQADRPAPVIRIPVIREEKNAVALAVGLLFFALMLTRLGFIYASSATSVLILAYLRVRKWQYYLISLLFNLLVYYVFTRMLYVALP